MLKPDTSAKGSGKSILFEKTFSSLRNYIQENGPLRCPPEYFTAGLTEAQPADQKLSVLPMTIFYCGQVTVLNLPSSKAEQVLHLASKANLDSARRPSTQTKTTSNDASRVQATRLPRQPIVAHLPIKTKASLSLFFDKRKNRINARAPYNIKGEKMSKADDKETSWLQLGAPSPNH